jgi:hypothetical protein
MGLPAPRLDDKTFIQLMEDVRKLIPRYAPEWTDFNTSDPGITFFELFASLTEQQRYYLDQIDDKSILKFLKLLGIYPKPAIAARADVTFSSKTDLLRSILVPKGTKLSTRSVNDGDPQLIFETEAPLWVVPARLDKIISVSSIELKDNTAINQIDGLSFAAFGEENSSGDRSLYLGFNLPFLTREDIFGSENTRLITILNHYFGFDWIGNTDGIIAIGIAIQKSNTTVTITDAIGSRRLTFHQPNPGERISLIWDVNLADGNVDWTNELLIVGESTQPQQLIPRQGIPFPPGKDLALTVNLFEDYPVKLGQHNDEIAEVLPSIQLEWEYFQADQWLPLTVLKDETRQLTRSGRLWFKSPDAMTADIIFSSFSQALYWIRVRIKQGDYEIPPRIDAIRLNTISAIQHNTFCKATAFSSNGQLTQTFPASYLTLSGANIQDGNTVQVSDRSGDWQDLNSVSLTPDPENSQITIAFPSPNVPFLGENNIRLISYQPEFRSQLSLSQSNGLPNQRFQLDPLPVIAEQLALQVQEMVELGETIVDQTTISCLLQIQRTFPVLIQSGVPINVTLRVVPKQNLARIELRERLESGLQFAHPETLSIVSDNPPVALFRYDHLQAEEPIEFTYQVIVLDDGKTIGGDILIYDNSHCLPIQESNSISKLILRGTSQSNYWQDWTQVPDLDASRPTDSHYIVEQATGQLQFGDGINGAIPAVMANDIDNLRLCSYQTCQGALGNVAIGKINTIVVSPMIPGLAKLTVTNAISAVGGTDPETLEFAQLRARKQLKIPTRAVTSEDFEFLALATPGLRVARAKAIPFVAQSGEKKDPPRVIAAPAIELATATICPSVPKFRTEVIVPPHVTVVVVPYSPAPILKPTPSQGFLKTVCLHLDRHRLITTKVEVIAPTYVGIGVNTTLRLRRGFSEITSQEQIDRALQKFLHPLEGGTEGKGWEFGRTVYRSEIYQVLEIISSVDCVQRVDLNFQGVGANRNADGNIAISPQSLVYSLDHQIEVINPEAICRSGEGL